MHSTQRRQKKPPIDLLPGKLINMQPCPKETLSESEETGCQPQQEQIWKDGKERDLPTDGRKVVMTTNFHRDGCPCEFSNRKMKIIKQPRGGGLFSSFMSAPHCELVAKGSDWWIRDLKSAQGTFVNGTKLLENEEQKLHDLDIVSMGVSHMDPVSLIILDLVEQDSDWDYEEDDGRVVIDDDDDYCKGAPHVVYRYKAPTLRNTDDKEEQANNLVKLELESHLLNSVIENELIISTILSNLPLSDLKNARLVCQKWRKESTNLKLFYSCTRVDIPGLDCPHWSYLKDNYDSYFKGKQIENVSLCFDEKSVPIRNNFHSFLPNQERHWEVKEKLYMENVDWFLDSFGPGIKSFKLYFNIEENNWSSVLRIFEKLPTVEDLQLRFLSSLKSQEDMMETVKFPEEMPKLSSVKSLSIQINDDSFGIIEALTYFRGKFEPLLVGLFRIFPSVEKLTFPDQKVFGLMEIFISIIKDNTILIPKVKDLAITFDEDEDFLEDKTIEILTDIPFVNKLRSLELNNLTDCDETILNQMISLIKKTAPYLEILALGFKETNTFIAALMEEGEGDWFPEFPKLWRLKILTMNSISGLPERDSYPRINYETVFPNLTSLKFGGMLSNRLSNSHLQHFLRMENDPCQTVVEFELFITSTIETEPVELRQGVVEKFPNVVVPRIKFSFQQNDELENEFIDGSEYTYSDHSRSDSDNSSEEDDDDNFDSDEDDDDNLDHDEDEDDNLDHDEDDNDNFADYLNHNDEDDEDHADDDVVPENCQHQ